MRKLFLIITLLFYVASTDYAQPDPAENPRLFPVSEGGKVGYIDATGKKVIEPLLDAKGSFNRFDFTPAQYFHEGVAVAAKCLAGTEKCKEGFIDRTGTFVIPPIYEQALQFSEGLAAVKTGGQWGYINHRGVMIIKPQFVEADLFENGLAVVTRQGKGRQLINRAGKLLKMPPGTEDFSPPSEKMIAVKIRGKWGFINQRTKLIIRPRFEPDLNDHNEDNYFGKFINGLASVRLNNKWGAVNRQGKLVIQPKYRAVMLSPEREIAIVALDLYDWRLTNRRGDFVSRRKFEALHDFSEGLAGVRIKDRWGFIDRTGKIVIPAIFDEVGFFSDGLAAAQVNQKWGYIDRTGRFVIEPRFEYQGYFQDGLAKQTIEGSWSNPGSLKWGYLDRAGKFVWRSE